MEYKKILENLSIENHPVGIGGCKSQGPSYDCCEYDITVFDGKKEESFLEHDGNFYHIYHGTLEETSPDILLQYDGMTILVDEQWELRMLLSKIKEKKQQIFNAYVKNCLVESGVCITKAKHGLNSDPYSSSWVKCAAYFLADAISVLNSYHPSPVHMLKTLRELPKNKTNEAVSVITDSIGIERATSSLLSRMLKSTMGFSDLITDNFHSRIISRKYNYLVENSLLSDCYFYLGYVNRNNFKKIQDLHRKPELIHLLKTGFDLENDTIKVESDANNLYEATNFLLSLAHE
ncbi:MAG: hypothetical protein CM1200mP23_3600 [Nitrososphaerota archaeon]|nr:MAG: hypothetical protein CM1200mP23_3600 [Nitrososphaerota archaeon]